MKKVAMGIASIAGLWLLLLGVASSQNVNGTPEVAAVAAGGSAAASSNDPAFKTHYPRYQLVAGDTLDLQFEYSPEFNQTLTIQPDGYITLRDIGDVHVEGKTVPEVTDMLRDKYAKILSSPSIAVVVKDFEKPYFTASGQVGRPGHYVLHGETTVTEALAMAGGLTDKSKHSQVVLFRRVSSQWTEAKVLNVKKMLNAKDLQEDLFIHPGDMLYVPQNKMSKIARFIPSSGVTAYMSPASF
ncbi:MAG TPA: polysaccharide biosynthesis/export family protein [Candidatus Sulfotelmatobacter sp.]|nr:polysaccharide biosynthesis/export family protein [Candidatus Sulfotelmatobacter sp.]